MLSTFSHFVIPDKDEEQQYYDFISGAAGMLAIAGIGVAAASAYYWARKPRPSQPPFDLQHQTIVEGPELIHYSRFTQKGNGMKFMRYLYEDTKTLYDVFPRGARISNNGPCLGWRNATTKEYQWMNYKETMSRSQNFGSGLVALGLKPGPDTLVGVYSQNNPEWVLSEYGLYSNSMVVVPLYDTLGPDASRFIINQAEMSLVICENEEKCKSLLTDTPVCLKIMVHIKPISNATVELAKSKGITTLSFEYVENLGAQNKHKPTPPKPEDLCIVCYTSGTTGNPKGVMLTHENVIADASAILLHMGDEKPNKTDVMISFLPLAHMLERISHLVLYIGGGSIGFFGGDVRNLMDDMVALKPTITPAVPRIFNRIYDKVQSGLKSSSVKRFLFNTALSSKENDLRRGIMGKNTIWDKLVLKKVQDAMGGRIRLIVVGSAPLAGAVMTFMRCALGCVIIECYGLTECAAPTTLTVNGDFTPEHVGTPIPCCAIKLVDVPDMNYFAASGRGEICIKGTNVFKGYFKDPEKTKETIDKDGWLHTGDIGTFLDNGTLKIIDRKKHIFKLSQGEYIAPEKIESIYMKSQYVAQVFVHGESIKSCVIGVIVPDEEFIKQYAEIRVFFGSFSVLCNVAEIKQLILNDITELGKKGGLKSFEQVKDIYLHPELFTVQNGLLTPVLKSKRPDLRTYFKRQLEEMYSKLD
ncbi:long-chain-fatty-acid--CoA ligase 1-like isoform X2 [Daphnia pulicaria]|uniref:long-chain-fatty-acid--CoA ligase 1-like isoform X2 n=1 Tax=Daphnia pulicaria TaxID=35523 RepID=UPI001EEB3124|nr:long-chain-fatty-acid--CoA ligase 1-like isoform X2 [Daphnia pulicaria]